MPRCIPILVTGLLLTTAGLVYGQETTREALRKEVGISGILILPKGDWIHPRQSVAGGGGFRMLFPVASSPLSGGFDVQVLFYEEGWSDEQIIMAHGLLRATLGKTRRRPYVEALGGITGFSVDPGSPGTYSYGFGAGIQFPKAMRPLFGPNEEERIEIGVRYVRGGGVRLDRERFAATTPAVMVHVGVSFRF